MVGASVQIGVPVTLTAQLTRTLWCAPFLLEGAPIQLFTASRCVFIFLPFC